MGDPSAVGSANGYRDTSQLTFNPYIFRCRWLSNGITKINIINISPPPPMIRVFFLDCISRNKLSLFISTVHCPKLRSCWHNNLTFSIVSFPFHLSHNLCLSAFTMSVLCGMSTNQILTSCQASASGYFQQDSFSIVLFPRYCLRCRLRDDTRLGLRDTAPT